VLNHCSAMAAFDLQALVIQLGHEFKRREMPKHLQLLRDYYRREFRALEAPAWSTSMVLEWLALLQLGPFEKIYEVQPMMSGCPRCPESDKFVTATVTVWDDGALMRCSLCGFMWLQLHRETPKR
jgi:hypothetical protein